MRKRDAEYTIAGIVELDGAFFGAPSEGAPKNAGVEQTKLRY